MRLQEWLGRRLHLLGNQSRICIQGRRSQVGCELGIDLVLKHIRQASSAAASDRVLSDCLSCAENPPLDCILCGYARPHKRCATPACLGARMHQQDPGLQTATRAQRHRRTASWER